MRLIAQKPCSFGGREFFIGEEIPEKLVVNPKRQEKMGVLAIVEGKPVNGLQEMAAQVSDIKFEIIIHTQGHDLPLQVTNEELSIFTDILQTGTSKTEEKQRISEMIRGIESEDLLILLDALDGRKYIKEMAEARAKAIAEVTEENILDLSENVDGDE